MKKLSLLLISLVFFTACSSFSANVFEKNHRTPGTKADDNIINKIINRAIKKSSVNKNNNININTFNGTVLITGEVDSKQSQDLLTKIAKNIYQVRKIHNRTRILAPSSFTARSSDYLITTHIRANIFRNDIASKPEVKIVTESGIVYLMGIVNKQQKQQIIHIAKSVSGVQNIVVMFEIVD